MRAPRPRWQRRRQAPPGPTHGAGDSARRIGPSTAPAAAQQRPASGTARLRLRRRSGELVMLARHRSGPPHPEATLCGAATPRRAAITARTHALGAGPERTGAAAVLLLSPSAAAAFSISADTMEPGTAAKLPCVHSRCRDVPCERHGRRAGAAQEGVERGPILMAQAQICGGCTRGGTAAAARAQQRRTPCI
jgi:hypothetical protein